MKMAKKKSKNLTFAQWFKNLQKEGGKQNWEIPLSAKELWRDLYDQGLSVEKAIVYDQKGTVYEA